MCQARSIRLQISSDAYQKSTKFLRDNRNHLQDMKAQLGISLDLCLCQRCLSINPLGENSPSDLVGNRNPGTRLAQGGFHELPPFALAKKTPGPTTFSRDIELQHSGRLLFSMKLARHLNHSSSKTKSGKEGQRPTVLLCCPEQNAGCSFRAKPIDSSFNECRGYFCPPARFLHCHIVNETGRFTEIFP